MAIDGLNDQSVLDVRKIVSGKDGRLFVTNKAGTNIFLAEVNSFHVQLTPNNTDYQPVGSALVYSVNTGYSVSLTLEETVVRDDVMVTELISDLQKGYFPSYDFQGMMRRRDGQAQRIVYRNCVPDGTIDLQNLTPGDIIKRAWNFRVNSSPEILQHIQDLAWEPVE